MTDLGHDLFIYIFYERHLGDMEAVLCSEGNGGYLIVMSNLR